MVAGGLSWGIVPYVGDSAFKRARVYDEAQTQAVLRHLQAHECVALLGPPLSEKSDLLADVAEALGATCCFRPLYVDLWQTRSQDEVTFFTSLAWQIGQALGREAEVPSEVPDARAFQNYLSACVAAGGAHLALMVDHLQALPHDLVHSLLVALRSAYMEWDADAPRQFVAVVTGGMNLVGLSTGPTSPFNIAKPVVVLPLNAAQSLALAQATLTAHGCIPSPAALERIVEWCGGDRYLLPRLCAWSADVVRPYRRPVLTCAAVDRAAAQMCARQQDLPPIRAATRLIEEDPDTMLDVLHLLDHGALPRARSRQMPTRTGTDRLQLSGAVVLEDGRYNLLNQSYRQALAGHFTTERVAHILRIAGRWGEAIEYLAPRMAVSTKDEGRTTEGRRPPTTLPASSFQLHVPRHRPPSAPGGHRPGDLCHRFAGARGRAAGRRAAAGLRADRREHLSRLAGPGAAGARLSPNGRGCPGRRRRPQRSGLRRGADVPPQHLRPARHRGRGAAGGHADRRQPAHRRGDGRALRDAARPARAAGRTARRAAFPAVRGQRVGERHDPCGVSDHRPGRAGRPRHAAHRDARARGGLRGAGLRLRPPLPGGRQPPYSRDRRRRGPAPQR